MDSVRIGTVVRRLRARLGLRQTDLAARAGVSARTVGRIERRDLAGVSMGHLERVIRALGASLDLVVRWHGGDLVRTLHARHSAMHEAMARWFRTLEGWIAVPDPAAIRAALPDDGRRVGGWLSNPVSPFAGFSFLPDRLLAPIGRTARVPRRVDRPTERTGPARSAPRDGPEPPNRHRRGPWIVR
ncbi:MAG TPA: helix-turn-helix transcriptional regulator [Candidatus Limnocylindrales bacterium]|nr:helix-turn-helix transcriptional regulator [Candidatus Limnocylindrales bacterium]